MSRLGEHHPKRWLWIAVLALGASACSDVEALRRRAAAQTGFSGALAKEYLAYAESEREQGHWRSAERLAAKGLEASAGRVPALEVPPRPSMSGEDWRVLTDARQRLGDRLTGEAMQKMPDGMARAQLLYECWLAQTVEHWQPAAEAPCGGEFEAAMGVIERETLPGNDVSGIKRVAHMVLPFAAGQSQLSNAAIRRLGVFSAKAQKLVDYRLYVTGYADAAGAEDASRALARARAGQARDSLLALGIKQDKIIMRSGGILAPVEFEQESPPAARPLRRVEVVLSRVGVP